MKKILLLLFMSFYAFSLELQQDFLEPDEAFKKEFIKQNDKVIFSLNLGKNIYLYDDKLKVFITKPSKIEITEEVNIPEPVEYDEFIVHFDNQNIEIPFSLLKSKVDSSSYEIEVKFQGCSKAGLCYAPMSDKYTLDLNSTSTNESTTKTDTSVVDTELNETDTIANTLKTGNMLLVLATFFGFGLLLSFTPCVFPMIPILSSIIVGASQNEKMTAGRGFFLSLIYVLAMAMAYTIAGVIAGLFGANLQVALQNPYVLTVFAAVFVALAFSMFGYFRIELPQSIQNKINKSTDGKEKQGVVGIAIMGFLSALIVGPCVAPPLAGALVYIGQTGDAVLGGLALFVLSIGMGMPLLLIGLGAGKFMPKPGGWMDSVSKVFGIIMLAIAVWMLDRVLDASIVMFLWSALFLGAAIYLNVYKHILAQTITAIIFLYGVALFFGTISGATNPLKPFEKFTNASGVVSQTQAVKFSYIKNIKELDLAIAASSKPVMLDFYADWCVSCKELEEITFKDAEVIKKLQGFTLLKADVTKNNDEDKALQAKYGIVGPPGLIFWNENNEEVKASKIVGYKNPKDFLEIVNKYFK
ncbi:protein-disulfide reductase DsbD [Poseidonibacter ostreae]|jgi:thioredoxin:protein disulfide reductase|uniref:Protein-disulfide reductase DsbD n=1 Tax=Poseidonibacter ostreae TaxID=2654171 RepID=A0A6L4WSQ3_9BACT|nr:protein-disulfide reductase DsbD [Poseidonibacter ostreae]KAB7886670.1 protein-disulfide reductase DsbD [Poseidonibacter ostreae]KAB7889062.1 protein-disulfide reductase DsbD [Poseidonibacter ostreae]KAB7891799.1 protein-disulfide reductase DsbD [Poseidonibacter ostreae]